MQRVDLADAKTRLSALVERAAAGETVLILRHGKPVAQITAIPTKRKAIDPAALSAITRRMPVQSQDEAAFMRALRGVEWY